MAGPDSSKVSTLTVVCLRCDRPFAARPAWAGRDVQCPYCGSNLRVPPAPENARPVRALSPGLMAKFRFNFGCPRCKTMLEAHTGMARQEARCPTCGAMLIVPSVDPRTGMPGRVETLETDQQDPTPMHAYAASGDQAPQIHRLEDGSLIIECPRCGEQADIDVDSCPSCGAPFTIDAAPTTTGEARSTWAAASLVLGIVSVPLFFLILPGVLATFFGLLAVRPGTGLRMPKMGIAGLILGVLSVTAGAVAWLYA